MTKGAALPAEDLYRPGSVHVSLEVPDLDAAVARLRAAGYGATDPETLEGMRRPSSRAAGPDGLRLQLVQA